MSRPSSSSSSCAAVDCRALPFRRAWLARLLVHTRPVEALERGCVCVWGGGGGVRIDVGEYIYLVVQTSTVRVLMLTVWGLTEVEDIFCRPSYSLLEGVGF